MKRIFVVDSKRTARDQSDDSIRHLDELRSEFFLDLSHQLRTPVTAMKLAMDGLFSQLRDVLTPSQRNLARISQRNIERIVALVENQLDLLQMLAGGRGICRSLTDLDRLLCELPRRPFVAAGGDGDHRPVVERGAGLEAQGPLYLFTDPERLSAVIDCALDAGPPGSMRSIRLGYDEIDCVYQLDITVDYPDQFSPAPADAVSGHLPSPDFESRAYGATIGQLGGRAVMEQDESRRWITIRLPRYPDFDGEKDVYGPARRLRSMAMERKKSGDAEPSVHFIRCDMGDEVGSDFFAQGNGPDCDFLERVRTVLSEGDAVIRARQHGTIYLALVSRTPQELEHAVAVLQRGRGAEPYVWIPDTVVADSEIDLVARDLELV